MVHFYRASICEGGLGVVILSVGLSVRPSVTRVDCLKKTSLNDALLIFLYHTKGQSLWHFDTNSALVGDAPVRLKSALKVAHVPFENADFDGFPLIMSQP